MHASNKEVTPSAQTLPLFWQNAFVWLAGFIVIFTLVKVFEYRPNPAEISLLELGFFAAVFFMCRRHFEERAQAGESRWSALVELSLALVTVFALLIAVCAGVDWLAGKFSGNWRVAARILNSDMVWLGCFLLAIYHPGNKGSSTETTGNDADMEVKP